LPLIAENLLFSGRSLQIPGNHGSQNEMIEVPLPPHLPEVVATLVWLETEAANAARTVRAKAGRPQHVRSDPAAEIAVLAGKFYFELSGKIPSRYNEEFVDLLKVVYRVLAVPANARSRARELRSQKTGRR
jgi:hypothetical protein